MEKPANIRLSEGQLVCWQGSSRKIYGIARKVADGEIRIFVDDVHSFAIKDVETSMVVLK